MEQERMKNEAQKLASANEHIHNVVAKAIRFALQDQPKEIEITLGFAPEMVPKSAKGVLADKPFNAEDYTIQGMCLLVVKVKDDHSLDDNMQKLVYAMETRRVSIGALQDNNNIFPVIFSVMEGDDLEEKQYRDYCLFARDDIEDRTVVECGRDIARFLRAGILPRS